MDLFLKSNKNTNRNTSQEIRENVFFFILTFVNKVCSVKYIYYMVTVTNELPFIPLCSCKTKPIFIALVFAFVDLISLRKSVYVSYKIRGIY